MKLMLVTPYFYPAVGGLENYALNLALGLRAEGHDVLVVTSNNDSSTTTDQHEGLRIIRLPRLLKLSNTPLNPFWAFQLRAIIKRERPDIINAHTPVPFMVDMAALAAGRTPFIVTYHAATLFKPGSPLFTAISYLYLPLQRLTLSRARSIFAVSDYVKQSLPARYHNKIFVMPNATHLPSMARSGSKGGLVFVANLEPTHAWKGLDVLIDSLAVLRASGKTVPSLTVIGDGSYRTHYEGRVQALGLKTVFFAGRQVGTKRDRLMSRAQALVMCPTTANDAFPTVLLEAWSLGLPVIASAIGPIPSLIEDGVTGLLVPAGDKYALARAISSALAKPEKLKTMGTHGRRRVRAEYNWDVQVTRASQLLKQLV